MSHPEQQPIVINGVLRAFVESLDADAAHGVALELCSHIDSSLNPSLRLIERYQKVPEWFEIIIGFSSTDSIEQVLQRIQHISTRWAVSHHGTDASAMWTPEIGGNFAHPKVRWANVECFQP